jgi:hypothetical protein
MTDRPTREGHHLHADGSEWADDNDWCLALQHSIGKRIRLPEWRRRALEDHARRGFVAVKEVR